MRDRVSLKCCSSIDRNLLLAIFAEKLCVPWEADSLHGSGPCLYIINFRFLEKFVVKLIVDLSHKIFYQLTDYSRGQLHHCYV